MHEERFNQVDHDRSRGVGPTISYFYSDDVDGNDVPIKVRINDPTKVNKLRALRNDRTASLAEVGLPEEARLSRVDVTLVNTRNPDDVEVIFISGIHADEVQTSKIYEINTSNTGDMSSLPRAEIIEPNDTAAMLGRRDNLVPIKNEEVDALMAEDALNLVILPKNGQLVNNEKLLGLDVIAEAWTEEERTQFRQAMDILRDGDDKSIDYSYELKLQKLLFTIRDLLNNKDKGEIKQKKINRARRYFNLIKPLLKKINESKNFILARKINLNRQFPVDERSNNFENSRKVLTWPEAKLLVTATADLPNAKYIFSLHEDPENYKDGSDEEPDSYQGFYFYDTHYFFNDDPDRDLVFRLKEELIDALKKEGFHIKNGIDDPNDPDLGLSAENGYINAPIINKDDQMDKVDGTYETAMVALGLKNILKIERAFCFEIPGKISSDRKTLLLSILQEKFILPFLKAKDCFK
ncbi:MAG: hypothetical protein COZ34_03045 [Candidatus Pacebacteria bacterium CG_4_10_14_3_um_filter_34_15]|nr:M14 family metallocarboxypeptidase [Candidatus Paceibacterota bacterium]OIO44543.1 MAG: hypothetical protein AUJ41_02775 [Candidatus Pacebacteria bacterium CG1_02_43_31]PIQ81254.1 MAG: hypothetical protein COV78_01250 [Candidatus Pacebacteria bacterium CG11_big_fil_rev_8_21_14_0_20_34_55]PIX81490.1 MAG: hypothetical protein COZ34_03045 [Candidatus Pacebacteria bacterium CG_4_10_14_3_um_filter_34_15]PJC43327.1 MAG: hypothetical protein CO039_04655 [Candidatus Pacebacteria bacterium CG_4_9_14_